MGFDPFLTLSQRVVQPLHYIHHIRSPDWIRTNNFRFKFWNVAITPQENMHGWEVTIPWLQIWSLTWYQFHHTRIYEGSIKSKCTYNQLSGNGEFRDPNTLFFRQVLYLWATLPLWIRDWIWTSDFTVLQTVAFDHSATRTFMIPVSYSKTLYSSLQVRCSTISAYREY